MNREEPKKSDISNGFVTSLYGIILPCCTTVMFFGDSIWMSDGGGTADCPLLPDDGVGDDGPDGPFSWSISLPPTTGSACTMVVAVGDVPEVTEIASGCTIRSMPSLSSASDDDDDFPMYSWKLPSEDDFIAGLEVLIALPPAVPPSLACPPFAGPADAGESTYPGVVDVAVGGGGGL
uniref:Uncharacterized protein n=1 Tax=Anopheles farauti TaxID=69004 RepID=A0A182QL83_9DIPT